MRKVILVPSIEAIETVNLSAYNTVEAEYGNRVIEGIGGGVTLAHHGSRSANPAPCIAEVEPNDLPIIVSHFDLDTLGGIIALWGERQEGDLPFWKAAAFVDVNGLHRLPDSGATPGIENRMYAWQAYNAKHRLPRAEVATDITDFVMQAFTGIRPILAGDLNELMLGQDWFENNQRETEARLVFEDENIRAFVTEGYSCLTAYRSPKLNAVAKALCIFNTTFNSITVAFEDNGKEFKAVEVVQSLFGEKAGGQPGIAGSPRGQKMTRDDFEKAIAVLKDLYK